MKKLGEYILFFVKNRGSPKKSRNWWPQIILTILFNIILHKCIFSTLRALRVTSFFNIVGTEGVIKFLIMKMNR